MYKYNAIIENVIDGDTFDLNVDLGFNIWYKIRVRLLEIDTPELKNKKGNIEKDLGMICKQYAIKYFLNKECVIQSFKEATKDSFGRYLVYCYVDGINLVDAYNELGFNKLSSTYSKEKIKEIGKEFIGE